MERREKEAYLASPKQSKERSWNLLKFQTLKNKRPKFY